MKTVFRYSGTLVGVYLAAWTASYVIMVGLDFSHFFEYFRLAWTFNGGELPTFIWWFSVLAFLPLAVLAVFLLKRYQKRLNTS